MEQYLEEMEQYARENDIPIMQKEGIQFLQKIIKENQSKNILEIGSAIGYSAIQMCRMDKEIHVVTMERDDMRYQEAVENVRHCQLEGRITLLHVDALEAEIEGLYDLIFIDAAKAQYIRFFERYQKNLAPHGMIVSDNLKFHGMVESKEPIRNRNTRQLVGKIRKYISYLKENASFETIFYDCGDGVAISRRKECGEMHSD